MSKEIDAYKKESEKKYAQTINELNVEKWKTAYLDSYSKEDKDWFEICPEEGLYREMTRIVILSNGEKNELREAVGISGEDLTLKRFFIASCTKRFGVDTSSFLQSGEPVGMAGATNWYMKWQMEEPSIYSEVEEELREEIYGPTNESTNQPNTK